MRLKVAMFAVAVSLAFGGCGARTPPDPGQPHEIKAFSMFKVHISVGMTKAEVRNVVANGRDFHPGTGKYYAFRPIKDETYATDSWSLTYGPEVGGLGRVDILALTFKDEKLTKIMLTTLFCP